MRVAFLGTPDFALPSLQMLIDDGHTLMAFTQPDRPVGRKAVLTPPPVKVLAEKNGIHVFQCEKIRQDEGIKALADFAPDIMVTAAFGQILSRQNLDIPKYGCINVHGSLLPKYRGAAPIQWAIVNGEKKTGITTMMTDVGLDTGDILLVDETDIYENETAGELFERLAILGAHTLHETIAALLSGTLKRTKQDESQATKCGMIKKEHAKIDFSHSSQRIHDLVRGMNPWPCAYAQLDGENVKIMRTRLTDKRADGKIGECAIADAKDGLFVKTGDGLIEVVEIQFPNGKRMEAKTALRGKSLLGRIFA